MNVKLFNLMSEINETRFFIQHESYECKYRLNENVCNSKLKRRRDECCCECQELDDWSSSKKDYTWNPSICNCECDKACKIGEYLDINVRNF